MKKLFILILTCLALTGSAQVTTLYNALGTNLQTDTVSNTGTGYVQVKVANQLAPKLCNNVSFQAVLTKISGTVAGTVTIMGSLDGTNYKAIPTAGTQTSVTTATALDVASQVFTWNLTGSPYPYYRISWTGSGTMSATIAGKVFRN
jgi:hypothetical protein